MTALLEARGVSAGYHGYPVVHSLDLEVHAGEIVAFLGANGAGKSTTLLTLAGELTPLSGEVLLDGEPTRTSMHRRAQQGVALVPEDRSVFMGLTTLENLRVGRCDIDEALELFPELKPLLKRPAALLSGGEQQMLTVARALARKPRVLLIDELSLGLAPLAVDRLLNAVREASRSAGVGVLLVEQHVALALGIADRVVVMRRGRIVLAGTPAEVEHQLEAEYLSVGSDEVPHEPTSTKSSLGNP